MFIPIIIFTNILLIQIIAALYAVIVRRSLVKTYSFPLSSQMDAANTLEKYSRVCRSVNLKVHEDIKYPAIAMEEFLIINRNKVYLVDLFTNYFIIFQLELSRKKHNFARNMFTFQNFVFFLELVAFSLSFVVPNDKRIFLLAIAIVVEVIAISSSFWGFGIYEYILRDTHTAAIDLLDLDNVEQARAEALKKDLKYRVFEYPLQMLSKIMKFFVPSR